MGHNNKVHTIKDEIRLNSTPLIREMTPEDIENTRYLVTGRLTLGEWYRLSREIAERIAQERSSLRLVTDDDCTCQPALPDGREIVCSFCKNHNHRITDTEI